MKRQRLLHAVNLKYVDAWNLWPLIYARGTQRKKKKALSDSENDHAGLKPQLPIFLTLRTECSIDNVNALLLHIVLYAETCQHCKACLEKHRHVTQTPLHAVF